MSLILEALKKSEAERQRHSGPTLLEVRIAKPQRRYPVWALAVGILLAVNMILLLVFMLRKPSAPAALASPVAATVAGPMQGPVAAVAANAPAVPAPSQPIAPPALAPMQNGADRPPTLADQGAGEADNPADDQPAVPKTSGSVKVQRDDSGGYSSLPSFSEVNANMPDFRLDLHVYADRPRDRYALINMQTVREGDALSEGARVLAITRDGVALEYHGQQFMLRPQ
jgi:general secretion pathway protein B